MTNINYYVVKDLYDNNGNIDETVYLKPNGETTNKKYAAIRFKI